MLYRPYDPSRWRMGSSWGGGGERRRVHRPIRSWPMYGSYSWRRLYLESCWGCDYHIISYHFHIVQLRGQCRLFGLVLQYVLWQYLSKRTGVWERPSPTPYTSPHQTFEGFGIWFISKLAYNVTVGSFSPFVQFPLQKAPFAYIWACPLSRPVPHYLSMSI